MAKTVAVIGASSDRRKFGNKALRAFERQGYRVIPINPNEPEVEGHRTYASVLDVMEPIDMATMYVPPEVGETLLAGIAEKKIPELWVNPGAESRSLLERARELGLEPIVACSIISIGESPYSF
jgi:predicted CoA-binding protein